MESVVIIKNGSIGELMRKLDLVDISSFGVHASEMGIQHRVIKHLLRRGPNGDIS